MNLSRIDSICPYVRMMRIKRAFSMTGKWQDFDHVFTYLASGSAEFVVDGVRYNLGYGDIIVIPPYQTHVILSKGAEPLVQYIIHFDFFEDPERIALENLDVLNADSPKLVPEQEKLMGGRVFITSVPESERHHFQSEYMHMHQEFSGGQQGRRLLLRSYCSQLLVEALRYGQQDVSSQLDKNAKKNKSWIHIENAIEYINTNYNKKLDNEIISAAVGVSPNYLTRVFRNSLGISLHRYVTHIRIEKAQQFLLSGKCNITETAATAGFSGVHVFSKTFKAVLGITPSEYLDTVVLKDKFAVHPDTDPAMLVSRENVFYNG